MTGEKLNNRITGENGRTIADVVTTRKAISAAVVMLRQAESQSGNDTMRELARQAERTAAIVAAHDDNGAALYADGERLDDCFDTIQAAALYGIESGGIMSGENGAASPTHLGKGKEARVNGWTWDNRAYIRGAARFIQQERRDAARNVSNVTEKDGDEYSLTDALGIGYEDTITDDNGEKTALYQALRGAGLGETEMYVIGLFLRYSKRGEWNVAKLSRIAAKDEYAPEKIQQYRPRGERAVYGQIRDIKGRVLCKAAKSKELHDYLVQAVQSAAQGYARIVRV